MSVEFLSANHAAAAAATLAGRANRGGAGFGVGEACFQGGHLGFQGF